MKKTQLTELMPLALFPQKSVALAGEGVRAVKTGIVILNGRGGIQVQLRRGMVRGVPFCRRGEAADGLP